MSMKRIGFLLSLLLASACTLTSQPPTTPPPVVVIPTLTPFTAVVTQEVEITTDEPTTSGGTTVTINNPPARLCTPRTDWPSYTVVRGDTLASIARRTDSTVAALTTANCLTNANLISAGQALRVPVIPSSPATTPIIAQACVATVSVPATNLYSGAGNTYSIVSTIAGADTLIVVGHADSRWYQVTYPGTSNAWIDATVITLSGDCRSLPNYAGMTNPPVVSQPCTATVNVPATNLYSGAANTYSIVSTIAGADSLIVVGHADHLWYQVTYPGAASAWIDAAVVTLYGDCGALLT